MKDIKRFIISIVIVVVLMIIADGFVGMSFGYMIGNLPQTQAQASSTQYALTKSDADCIIIGNSRASQHYVSHTIADSIGMTVYNAGRDGHDIAYSDCVIHEIFDRYSPKVVILEYDDALICTPRHVTVNSLKPYYGQFDYTTSMLDKCNNWSFKVSMCSNLYRYNNFFVRILEGYIKPRDVYDGYCSRGEHHINDAPITCPLKLKESKVNLINKIGVMCLYDIIKLCEDHQTKLFVVTSPRYSEYYTNNPVLATIASGKKDVYIINDMTIPGFHMHPEWFYDENHLNEIGAQEFSKKLGSQLRVLL
jgi:hypothetical protein